MLALGYIAFQNRQKGLEKPYHKDYRKFFASSSSLSIKVKNIDNPPLRIYNISQYNGYFFENRFAYSVYRLWKGTLLWQYW